MSNELNRPDFSDLNATDTPDESFVALAKLLRTDADERQRKDMEIRQIQRKYDELVQAAEDAHNIVDSQLASLNRAYVLALDLRVAGQMCDGELVELQKRLRDLKARVDAVRAESGSR